MSSSELDEAQGLTADQAREWLRANGWTYCHRGPANDQGHPYAGWGKGKHWIHDDGDGMYLDNAISQIADERGESEQATLRELNPRLRPGLPSDAAVYAHRPMGGVWIGCHGELGHGGSIVFLSFDRDDDTVALWDGEEWHNMETEMIEDLPNWRFWPCDANGQRVRWPVDGNGVML